MSGRLTKLDVGWILALLVLVWLLGGRYFFSNLILARGDMFLYFYPYWQAASDGLRAGRLPLWNPDIFMGAPLLANSQMGFFYPLNWPFWLLLEVPAAVKGAVALHLGLAAAGTYLLGRKLILSRPAAGVAAFLFAGGGYLTAQIEHLNQLQGLAWLPWLLWIATFRPAAPAGRRRQTAGFALLFALQFLAGHTQTVFISGVTLLLYFATTLFLTPRSPSAAPRSPAPDLRPFILSLPLALLLAAAQLLPTLELTRLSSRAGGLTAGEVVSFSWHPLLVPRALLPQFGQGLFTEYVAWLPITALLLALVAAGQLRDWRVRVLLVLAGAGLFLALGRFNGLYWLLAELPGFNLFRVPARWLVLYALAGSLLAGLGFDRLGQLTRGDEPKTGGRFSRMTFQLGLPVGGVILLIAAQFAAVWLGRWIPVGPEAPLEWPSFWNLAFQLAELLAGVLLLFFLLNRSSNPEPPALLSPSPTPAPSPLLPFVLLLLALSLYATTRTLPVNNPTTAEAYFDRRPPSLRLEAAAAEAAVVPDRFLSLSEIFFDPGDRAEIDTIYAGLLREGALYDYTIAIKLKEIISPNLGMVYGLPSVDGFDGGVLPLNSYSELVSSTLLEGQVTTDGRLREFLPAVPAPHWLALFDVGYVITDKVGDVWVDGVYYDRQLPQNLLAEEEIAAGFLPSFLATEIRLLSDGETAGRIVVETEEGESLTLRPLSAGDGVWRATLPQPARLTALRLAAGERSWPVAAISLVNGPDKTFYPLVLGPFRLIHSGDVKIYHHTAAHPRAVLIDSTLDPVDEEGLALALAELRRWPEILEYAPERVVVRVSTPDAARLVLLDAAYPGWQVTIDGRPAELSTAAGFFRAVDLPPGQNLVVTFTYDPPTVRWGIALSLFALVLTGLIFLKR